MCGIAGFLETSPARQTHKMEAIAARMLDTLRHRGPDDYGVWVRAQAGVALGLRRLAIIDLSLDGHQPMVSSGGRYAIVFDGEIYNWLSGRQCR